MEKTSESAPRAIRIISTPGQIDADTQRKIRTELDKMDVDGGSTETIPISDQEPVFAEGVRNFGGEVLNAAETLREEWVEGKGVETETRSVPGRGPRHWVMARVENIKNRIKLNRKP